MLHQGPRLWGRVGFPFPVAPKNDRYGGQGKLPVTGSQKAAEERDGQNMVKKNKQARSSGI